MKPGRRLAGLDLARGGQRPTDRQQRPGQRVLEEARVEHRVQQQRQESCRDRGSPRIAADPTEQGQQRRHHQRRIERKADHALLGGDRDRDRVRLIEAGARVLALELGPEP